MERDNVRLPVECFPVHILRVDAFREFFVGIQVVEKDIHAVAVENLRENLADLSGTDDAGGLAVEVLSNEAGKGKVSVAGPVVCGVNAPIQCLEEGGCVLRYRMRRVCRYPDHVNFLVYGFKVHIVVSRAAEGDELNAAFMKLCDNLFGYLVVHEDTDNLMSPRKSHGGSRELAFKEVDGYLNIVICQFLQGFLEVLTVIRFSVEKGDVDFFLHCSLLFV